jgi:hypothetical protein
VPISVADVRAVFSVRRETTTHEGEARTERPYSFRGHDIESLIYKQAVPVLTDGDYPSGEPAGWADVMQDLISSSLEEFMSQNRLADFYAGIGSQELELSEFRGDSILSKTLQLSNEVGEPSASIEPIKPRFLARSSLSSNFKKYSTKFSLQAQERGLELHWIGVGTWRLPEGNAGEAINEKHLEAWRTNRENAQRTDAAALELVTEQAIIAGKLSLIRETPISSHEENKSRYSSRAVLLECLLQDFLEQLGAGLKVLYGNRAASPELEALEAAVVKLEDLLRAPSAGLLMPNATASRVRPATPTRSDPDAPPAPASRAEAAIYQTLLGKLAGNYRVAEAMITNEARRHANLSREELITRIVQRFERHGR